MSEERPRLHDSVFAKLVAIMVALAVCLLVLVGAFFWLVLTRDIHHLIRKDTAHDGLLILLLLMILAAVVTAHAFLRSILRPLRVLSDGVARLGEGALEVHVPRTTRDEFGVLTGAFNDMVGRVGAMVRARDQLLVDVSHELRSPLTRMKVALELLPNDEHRARLAGDVVEMERMVTELLELEQLRSGRGMRAAPQDLSQLVRDVAERYRDGGVGVRLVSAPRPIIVAVDGEKVRTVLRNLIENALKYSLPDSHAVEIAVTERAGSAEVSVTDDGAGIPAGEVDRLFEPFYRADPSRSKSTGGYGLGLSICKRVMQAHGGSITAVRLPNRGAAFVLTFPRPD
ncbi:MAG: HAMP domain-containing sensor histidine kinase [Gemmatimonadaceae bacterium]